MIIKIYLSFLLSILLTFNYAQDIHTTQVQQFDYLYNPALVGNFKGTYRANMSSRSQWSGLNNAFQTFTFSADTKLFNNKWKKGYLGIGISANSDNSGNGFLKSNGINLGISSLVFLNDKNDLTLGFLSSYNQSKIDPSNIQWSTQFNGLYYDSNLPSMENTTGSQVDFFDVSAGIVWGFSKSERNIAMYDETSFKIGIAAYHLNNPSIHKGLVEDELQSRYTFFGKGFIGLNYTNAALVPSLLIQSQGPNREIIAGMYFRIRLKEASKYTGNINESALSFGGNWRYNDAISPGFLLEIKEYAIGVSYDLNFSRLTPATNMLGGVEITIKFLNPNPFLYKGNMPSL